MKSFTAKLIVLLIAILIITMIVPFGSVAAANEGVALVQTIDANGNENIVIYVDGLEKTDFDFALSADVDADDLDLNYTNSTLDDEENQVAVIAMENFDETKNNLYIRTNEEENAKHISLDFENILTEEKMKMVKNTSTRISTSVEAGIIDRTETVEGKDYTYTVGGLKIEENENAKYFYEIFKSTDEKYNELQALADELNSEEYESESMYVKIELANNFYNLYEELLTEVYWKPVDESMIIKQPADAEEGEKYIVMLKEVAEDGTETYDAKFMESQLGVEEGEDREQQEVTTTETSKLPITGDSIVLFVVLAALVIVAIVVFIRMKKLNKKADK